MGGTVVDPWMGGWTETPNVCLRHRGHPYRCMYGYVRTTHGYTHGSHPRVIPLGTPQHREPTYRKVLTRLECELRNNLPTHPGGTPRSVGNSVFNRVAHTAGFGQKWWKSRLWRLFVLFLSLWPLHPFYGLRSPKTETSISGRGMEKCHFDHFSVQNQH